MKLLLFGFGLLLQFVLCHSQVCLPTWTPYPRSFSAGGANESSARQLQDCLARCERRNNCLAADFDKNKDTFCWLHYNLSDLGVGSFRENAIDNVVQYRINRNCTDYGKGPACPPEWVRYTDTGSSNREQVNYWTEYDCFTHCRYSDTCFAVDYDNSSSPPCFIHKDPNPNSASSKGVVQYSLNKICPSLDNPTNHQIGRCVGQSFPTTGWCPPGTIIHINSSWFKVNPLCCYRNDETAYPPDSSKLVSVIIGSLGLDPAYFNEINSSCSGMSTCSSSIRAKGNSAIQQNSICSDGVIGTNYVSIVYQCISDGSTISEEMTTKTAVVGRGTPALSTVTTTPSTVTTTPSTVTTTPSDIEKAASNDATQKENSNRLIIGLVVGLGVPLILIIVIVIVVLVRRRRGKWKDESKESHQVDNYYYTSETAPRGAVPEYEQNEISMAVDSL